MSYPTSSFPLVGERVSLVRFTEGNTLRGDHKSPDITVRGTVVESPRHGSRYLVVKVLESTGLPRTKVIYDPEDPESYSLSSDTVSLRNGSVMTEWTVTKIEPAQPKVERTESGLRILKTKDEAPEPGHGSIVLLHGMEGTAWQRMYSDGNWRSTAGSYVEDWGGLWEHHVNKRQGVIVVLDVPEEG